MKKTEILIVEDERIVAADMKISLNRLGYDVCGMVISGEKAVKKAEELHPDLVLMDIKLSGEMDGIEAASIIRSRIDIPVIYLTAHADKKTLERAKKTEPYGYVLKPFEDRELNAAIEMALHKHKLEKMLKEKEEKLRRNLEDTINALSLAVEMRDPYTSGHQKRVTCLACAIAEELDLPKKQIEGIRMAGTVHDIGKILVPAEILSKPGKLTKIDINLIETHSQAGYDILKDIDFPWPVAQIVLQHHERMDGSGYPNGFAGEKILKEARILAVADVVEAISSRRPYRASLGINRALNEISKNNGLLFDPKVVVACMKVFKEKGFKLNGKQNACVKNRPFICVLHDKKFRDRV